MPRVVLSFLLLSTFLVSTLAQDPLKRMDPDDWLDEPAVTAMLEWAAARPECLSKTIRSDHGVLHRPIGSGVDLFLRGGDLRVVTDGFGNNRSVSHNVGFNLAAKHFVSNGTVYSLGGKGFWDAHAKLIQFIEKTGEWELVLLGDGPDCVTSRRTWYDMTSGEVLAIDEGEWGSSSATQDVVWRLDLSRFEWERQGVVNPRFQLISRSVRMVHDLDNFALWMGLHESAILRKSDGMAVIGSRWNQQEFEAIQRDAIDAPMSMVVASGNRLRVLSMNSEGRESTLLDWDVAQEFEKLASSAPVLPWVLPHEGKGAASLGLRGPERKNSGSQSRGIPLAPMALLITLVGVGAFFFGKRSLSSAERTGASEEGTSTWLGSDAHVVEPEGVTETSIARIAELEQLGPRILSTEEINQFLALGDEVSSESKRAKRAQFIREVNRMYRMRHGADMIVREKDLNDRRRTIYVIHPHSDTA